MPKFRIKGPDGRTFDVTAPEGATKEQVLAYVRKQSSDQAGIDDLLKRERTDHASLSLDEMRLLRDMRKRGTVPQINRGTADEAARQVLGDMSGFGRFITGMGKGFTDIGRGAGQLTGFMSREDVDAGRVYDKPLTDTGAGMAGDITAKALSALPVAAIPGANTLVGALAGGAGMGALEPVGTDDSRLTNILLGTMGGGVAHGAGKALGRVVKPVQSTLPDPTSALAKKAIDQFDIPLDAAQRTGSKPLRVMSDVLDELPFTGGKQAAARDAQSKAFNRAVLRELGENADEATPEILNRARERMGKVFTEVSARNKVKLDDDFVNAIKEIGEESTLFSSPQISEKIGKALELAKKGVIQGKEYQKIRTVLGKGAKDAFNSGNSELGQALKGIRTALDDAATRSVSGADQALWDATRKNWQALKVVEKAAKPVSADAVQGNIPPAKLAQALSSVDPKGYLYGTRKDSLGDLARIGQAFFKGTPNSGTAQRTFYQDLITNPVATAVKLPFSAIGLPVQKLLNSKAGMRYFTQGALPDVTNPALRKQLELAQLLAMQGAAGGGAAGLIQAGQ